VVGACELAVAAVLPLWLGWPFWWAGLGTTWVSLAYLAGRPGWLGKESAPWLSLVLLLPFHLVARGTAFVAQRIMRTRVEIAPGLWVGGWPRQGAPGLAQLDLTAELPRRGTALRYACVPMLDGAAPSPERWHAAVEQARQWRAEGLPVLVHCAYGHGRSVAVCIGVLVAEGSDSTWEAAHARVLAVRPRAVMTPAQRRMVAAAVAELPSRRAGAARPLP
jgi:hypothetical protein